MPNLFRFIGSSWDFCRRQSPLIQAALWFVFLPALANELLADYELANRNILAERPEVALTFALGHIVIGLILLWGSACVLSVGKRLLQTKAGRARTSFKTVRVQAAGTFIPLLLTSILRTIITALWSILLVVPGIVYFLRTAFYPVIVVCEGTAYRPALRQCLELSRGRFWQTAGTVIGLSILTFLPAQAAAIFLGVLAEGLPVGALVAADIASSLLFTLAVVLYLTSLVQAYDYFKPKGVVRN